MRGKKMMIYIKKDILKIRINLLLHNKTTETTDIIPDWAVPNNLRDGGLLESFWFDLEFHTVLVPPTQRNTVSSFSILVAVSFSYSKF